VTPLPRPRSLVWGAFVLALPFAFFGWILGGEVTLGNDYVIYPAAGALNLRFFTELGIEPMWYPHQSGGFPIGGLFFGQYFHLPAWLISRLPGFWTGEALRWISLRHLLLFALLQAVFYLGFRRAARLERTEAFLLSTVCTYSLRNLDALRYATALEATAYAQVAVLLALLHVYRPSPLLLLGVGLSTQLLLTCGYPVVIPFALLAAAFSVTVLVGTVGGRATLVRGGQAVGAALVGALLAAPHWLALLEWMSVNETRVARPRLNWAASYALEPGGIVANLATPWNAEVHSAFGGSTVLAIFLVVVTAGLAARARRAWPLLVGLGFAFAFALGTKTPVFPLLFNHVPGFSALRVPGRVLAMLPVLLFTGVLWLRATAPEWRLLAGRPARGGLATGLLLVATGVAGLAGFGVTKADLSPATLSEFWTFGPQGLWLLLGLVAATTLRWTAGSQRARAVLLAATLLQTGLLLRHGTWEEPSEPTPTREDFHTASHLPLLGEPPLIANNTLRRDQEGTATVPYARFLKRTIRRANCVLPVDDALHDDRPARLPFYLSHATVCVEDQEEARERIRRARGCLHDPLVRVYVVDDACDEGAGATAAGLAELNEGNRILALTPNLATLEVEAPREAVLVTPFPEATANWSGWIDGRPSPLLPINGGFLGMRVPPGRHTLSVRYFSERLVAGYRIAAASALVFAAALLFWWAGRRRWLAALLSAAIASGSLLAYTAWERGFVARARRETVLNHRYPVLLQEQLDHWRGRNEPAAADAP
jgi:hypothetical protein